MFESLQIYDEEVDLLMMSILLVSGTDGRSRSVDGTGVGDAVIDMSVAYVSAMVGGQVYHGNFPDDYDAGFGRDNGGVLWVDNHLTLVQVGLVELILAAPEFRFRIQGP